MPHCCLITLFTAAAFVQHKYWWNLQIYIHASHVHHPIFLHDTRLDPADNTQTSDFTCTKLDKLLSAAVVLYH